MTQRLLTDLSKQALLEYLPPDHSIGEAAWPGKARFPLRQLTLLDERMTRPIPVSVAPTPEKRTRRASRGALTPVVRACGELTIA